MREGVYNLNDLELKVAGNRIEKMYQSEINL